MKTNFKIILLVILVVFAVSLDALEWVGKIRLVSGGRTDYLNLFMGLDPMATDGFDDEFDIPTWPSPYGFYAYFTLTDTLYPELSFLSRDIRSSYADSLEWTIRHSGDDSIEPRLAQWNPDSFPGRVDLQPQAYIGANYPGLPIEIWHPMDSLEELPFLPAQEVRIRYFDLVSIPPDNCISIIPQWELSLYPNPLNCWINIQLTLSSPGKLVLSLYSIQGKLQGILFDGYLDSGITCLHRRPSDYSEHALPSGIYYICAKSENFTTYNKLVIIK
ncbi:T9SS type A sorting domain-containing protein [bacterium]|nr:T9SS type A sorting domain-containing protein [bacterium]